MVQGVLVWIIGVTRFSALLLRQFQKIDSTDYRESVNKLKSVIFFLYHRFASETYKNGQMILVILSKLKKRFSIGKQVFSVLIYYIQNA